ncbi:hypothetical protein AAUPMB_07357, partial [Pasteurella multocida subsp. multocida str. Anand1_buffalo]
STGDELVPVGQPLKEGQIYDTNRFTIQLLLESSIVRFWISVYYRITSKNLKKPLLRLNSKRTW